MTSKTNETLFLKWLNLQKDRNDPIGDLAQDWIRDNMPIDLSLAYLRKKGAASAALDAYREAMKEYNNQFYSKGRLRIIKSSNIDKLMHIEEDNYYYFGYITKEGYIALKQISDHKMAKKRFKEILEGDFIFIIPIFKAKGNLDAWEKLRQVLDLALTSRNNWENHRKCYKVYYG